MAGVSEPVGIQKTVAKLQRSVAAGDFYEAQQMYKSVSARYFGQKKVPEAMELLHSGACAQLRHGQVTCGSELGQLYAEKLSAVATPCSATSLAKVREIFDCFPRSTSTGEADGRESESNTLPDIEGDAALRVKSCSVFLKAALKWSANHGAPQEGAPEIYDMLADYVCSEFRGENVALVSQYFTRGTHPRAFASALREVMKECYGSERDLVVARGVLQYLAIGNLRDANVLLEELRSGIPSANEDAPPVPDSPLLHFLRFLLLTLERDALPLFSMLRKRYSPSIARDAAFEEYLDAIATKFYGVRKGNGLQGLMGGLMQMMNGMN